MHPNTAQQSPLPDPQTIDSDQRTWGMFAHLAALSGLLTFVGFVVGPLVVWLMKKDDMPFVDDQGKESMNFQITMFLASIVSLALCLVLIGVVLLPAVALFNLICTVIAMVRANEGVAFRYPLSIRFIR